MMTLQSFAALATASKLHFKTPMNHLRKKFDLILRAYLFRDNVPALEGWTKVRKGSGKNFIYPFGNGATMVFAVFLSRFATGRFGIGLGLTARKRTGLAMLDMPLTLEPHT